MTGDPKKHLDDTSEEEPVKEPSEENDVPDDESASVLFFGDKLENLVQGEKVSQANISSEPEEPEKTPMDSPSALFFGESLEEAAEREAREEAGEAEEATEETDEDVESDPDADEDH
jgi:hypothetical protein